MVPAVPTLDKLSLRDANHNDPRDANRAPARRHTQAGTRMSTFDQDADHNLVLFSQDVVDTNVKVGETTAQVPNERLQLRWAANFRLRVAETVGNATLRKQLVYGCLAAFVPNLPEPAADESFVSLSRTLLSRTLLDNLGKRAYSPFVI